MVENSEHTIDYEGAKIHAGLRDTLLVQGGFRYNEGTEGGFIVLSRRNSDDGVQHTLRTQRAGFTEEHARSALATNQLSIIVVEGDDPSTDVGTPWFAVNAGGFDTRAMYSLSPSGEPRDIMRHPQKGFFRKVLSKNRHQQPPLLERITEIAAKAIPNQGEEIKAL